MKGMERVTLAQISDIHLGRSFAKVADAAARERLRQILRGSLRKAVEVISTRNVDFLLICGDVFDRSEPLVKEASYFASEINHFLDSNPNAHVLVIPGGHDHLGPVSPYNTAPVSRLKRHNHFHLFDSPDSTGLAVNLRGSRVVFHARPHTGKSSGISPLHGLEPDPHASFNIALAHGSIAELIEYTTDEESTRDPVKTEEIMKFDYVALGDWHGYLAYPDENAPRACYSGSLEPTRLEEEPRDRGVLFVSIEKDTDSKVKVELENISQIRFVKKTVSSVAEVEKLIDELLGYQAVLFLHVRDAAAVDAIEARLAEATHVVYSELKADAAFELPDIDSLPTADLRKAIAEVAGAVISDDDRRDMVLRTIFAGLEGYEI